VLKLTKSLKPSLLRNSSSLNKKKSPKPFQQSQSVVFSSDGSESSCSFVSNKSERIKLNIGGVKYETTLHTLQQYPDTLLGKMFSEKNRHIVYKDEEGFYFIDRDGNLFSIILNYHRYGQVIIPPAVSGRAACKELDFFQIPHNTPYLRDLLQSIGDEVPSRSIFELADTMIVTIKPYLLEKAKKKSFFCVRLSASPEAVDEGADIVYTDYVLYTYLNGKGTNRSALECERRVLEHLERTTGLQCDIDYYHIQDEKILGLKVRYLKLRW